MNEEVYINIYNLKKFINESSYKLEYYNLVSPLFLLNFIVTKQIDLSIINLNINLLDIFNNSNNINEIKNDLTKNILNKEIHYFLKYMQELNISELKTFFKLINKVNNNIDNPLYFIANFICDFNPEKIIFINNNLCDNLIFEDENRYYKIINNLVNLENTTELRYFKNLLELYNKKKNNNHYFLENICNNKVFSKIELDKIKKIRNKFLLTESYYDNILFHFDKMNVNDKITFVFNEDLVFKYYKFIKKIKHSYIIKSFYKFDKHNCITYYITLHNVNIKSSDIKYCDIKTYQLQKYNNLVLKKNISYNEFYNSDFIPSHLFDINLSEAIKIINNINYDKKVKHISIIPDGNGRFGKKFFNSRLLGHFFTFKHILYIIDLIAKINIDTATFFLLSYDNINRPVEEMKNLEQLTYIFYNKLKDNFMKNDIKIICRGDINNMNRYIGFKNNFLKLEKETIKNNKLLTLCINYKSELELVNIFNNYLKQKNNIITQDYINYKINPFNHHPDLCIRTSGEQRLSSFLLWDHSYTEFVFNTKLFPEFNYLSFIDSIKEFSRRKRRFGNSE